MAIADPVAKINELRNERARLVAFSFARSDLLIELNRKGIITYASGASFSLTGRAAETLVGLDFGVLLAKASKTIFRDVRESLENVLRLRARRVFLDKNGVTVAALIAGCPLPQRPDSFFITLSHAQRDEDEDGVGSGARKMSMSATKTAKQAAQSTNAPGQIGPNVGLESEPPPERRDRTTGLLKADAFEQVAKQQMEESRKRNEPLKMTMVDLEGMDDFRDRVSDSGEQSFLRGVGAILNSQSEGGASATQLAPNKFGVLLADEMDDRDIQRQIVELAREVDPTGAGVGVKTTNIDLDVGKLNQADAAKALVYAVNKFAASQTGDFSIGSLSSSLNEMISDTVARVSTLRTLFEDNQFSLVYQPIVDVANKRIHHQEVLTRMADGGSPFAMVTFIEEVGVISEFDIAVCRKVLGELAKYPDAYDVGINLSGRSMESEVFLAELEALLAQFPNERQRVSFEITESSKITNLERVEKVVNRLRAARHPVYIDDFGSGAAAFHYLRAFKVDVVKIDGAYIKDIQTNERDRAFVRSIIALCQELGVGTVAEFVENEGQASILRSMGLQYGQGYLYDKPRPQIYQRPKAPDMSSLNRPAARRASSTARWS
jgi:EAL domain-containing protein (putative c-di-GMP-specific phosphodiesterase class I)/GGDEF domain-containing protein